MKKTSKVQWRTGGDCTRCANRNGKCKTRCEPREARDMAKIKKALILSAIQRREGNAIWP